MVGSGEFGGGDAISRSLTNIDAGDEDPGILGGGYLGASSKHPLSILERSV